MRKNLDEPIASLCFALIQNTILRNVFFSRQQNTVNSGDPVPSSQAKQSQTTHTRAFAPAEEQSWIELIRTRTYSLLTGIAPHSPGIAETPRMQRAHTSIIQAHGAI